MADWRKLLKDVLLADGVIDDDETALLEKEIMDDGVVDSDELVFLVELRNNSKESSAAFTKFFFSALKGNLLEDGIIDAEEAASLREILYADGVIDDDEKQFMRELKQEAKELCAEFDALFSEAVGD